jgi:hypothetical protein
VRRASLTRAVLAFAALASLLGLDAQGRNRPRLEALDADLLAGLEAVAVRAVLDTLQRLVDLADQLAFAIPGAQFEAELLFLGRAVVRVGEVRGLVLHVGDGAIHLHHQVALPAVEDGAEVLELLLAHVLFAALDDVRLYVARPGEQAARLQTLAVIRVGVHGRRRAARRRRGHRHRRGAARGELPRGLRGGLGRRDRQVCGRFLGQHRVLAGLRRDDPGAWRFGLAGHCLSGRGPAYRLLALRSLRRRSLCRHQ